MATTYAWSNFAVDKNEWGQVTKWIRVGDEVTQDALKVTDLDWQEFLDLGVVREQPYPDVAPQVSPTEYFKHLYNELAQGQLDASGMKQLESYQSVTRNVAAETSDAARGSSREVGGDNEEDTGFKLP
jgi:predicted glycosyl hydrolase (DUF1957 family)